MVRRVSGLTLPDDIDLWFVDGPPEATGPQARYPAVPILEAHLADRALIIMDDGRRAAEQAAVERWSHRNGMSASVQLMVERQALQLQRDRPALGSIQDSVG